MIAPDKVKQTLLPWLGTAFMSAQDGLCGHIAMMLFSFRPEKDSLMALAQQADNQLFMAVREATQGRMALEMDSGQLIRLRMNDFSVMADELLYLLFETMARIPYHQTVIREYSMRSGSLSALRALYLLYQGLQTPEETETIRRVITTCHEPYRFRHWIETEP